MTELEEFMASDAGRKLRFDLLEMVRREQGNLVMESRSGSMFEIRYRVGVMDGVDAVLRHITRQE